MADDTGVEKHTRLVDEQDRETFEAAFEKWGIEAQADMAEEECAEFTAVSKHHCRDRVPVEDDDV